MVRETVTLTSVAASLTLALWSVPGVAALAVRSNGCAVKPGGWMSEHL